MSRSLWASVAEVASSRIRIAGSRGSRRPEPRAAAALPKAGPLSRPRDLDSFGHLVEETRHVRLDGCVFDLPSCGVWSPVADVFVDRIVEEDRLLRHDCDLLAEIGQRDAANIDAVDTDRAEVRIVEPRQEIDEGRLTGTVLADDRDRFAGLDLERDALERGRTGPPLGPLRA